MRNQTIAALVVAVLAGCGGGDDKNRAPTASGGTLTLNEDAAATSVSVGASDPDGDALTLAVATAPTKGAVVAGPGTTFVYTPSANQNGTDQFTYTATDPDGLSATSTVTITITAQPDTPAVAGGTINTPEDTSGQVDITATDADGDALTITVTTSPAHGTLTVTTTNPFRFQYMPAIDYFGSDTFSYRVTDPSGRQATGTVNVSVAARPDAPATINANIATNEDAAGSAVVTALDPDGDTLTAAVASAPARGVVAISGSNPFTLTYTPNANTNGPDAFTYSVTDSTGLSVTANVSVAVAPQPDAPTIPTFNIGLMEDSSAAGPFPASDADGDPWTLTVTAQPAHGTLQITNSHYQYTPNANYFGTDSFTVYASDGTLQSAPRTVDVEVSAVNDAPVAADDAQVVASAGPTSINVLVNDSDIEGDTLTLEIPGQQSGVTAAVVNNRIQVTPLAGFTGPTRLSYRIRDTGGATDTADIRLVVGSASPLFFTAGTSPKRIYRYDYLSAPEALDTPVPTGDTLARFTTSANGAVLVYASRSPTARDRLWVRNLDDLSAPVFEVTTDASYFTNYLRLSPDGSLLVFNDRYATLGVPTVSREVEPGFSIRHPTFTSDGQRLFYSVLQPGGGFVINRADVPLTGILTNYLQMTANYAAGQGLGSSFRLTPDESRILSTGSFFVGGAINALKQHAFVTTANGTRDDAQLHPAFVNAVDFADLPVATPDSNHAVYASTINRLSIAGSTNLQAPGTTTTIGSTINFVGDVRVAGDSQTVFFTMDGILPVNWMRGQVGQTGSHVPFNPVGGGAPAPRVVHPAPDGSAVLFDSGARIYGTLGSQFLNATLLFERSVSSTPTIRYAPDSSSVAVANAAENGLVVLNPKSTGWYEVIGTAGTEPTGASCLAYAGEDC